MHLGGEVNAEMGRVYNEMEAEGLAGRAGLPSKDEFIKPTGTNRLALQFLASICVGASKHFEDRSKCFS